MLPARADAEIYLISRTTLFSYQQVTIQQPGLHLEFRHFEKRVITTHYRYDPLTRRIARSTGATPSAANTYQFAFSGSSPVHEWDGDISNTSYHQQRTGSGVGGLLQTQEADGTATHPRHNLRGDITAQFNASGTLLWHGSYASNGMLNHQYGTRDGKYGANGKYEESAGLINEGFRYRDRLTNNFLTRDPAGFIDGPNDYNYVRHNPWSAWDPNGLATVLIPQTTGDIGYVSPAIHSTYSPNITDANPVLGAFLSSRNSPLAGELNVAYNKSGKLSPTGQEILRMMQAGLLEEAAANLYHCHTIKQLTLLNEQLLSNPTPSSGVAYQDVELLAKTNMAAKLAGQATRGELRSIQQSGLMEFSNIYWNDIVPTSWDMQTAPLSYQAFKEITLIGAQSEQEMMAYSRAQLESIWMPSSIAKRAMFGVWEGSPIDFSSIYTAFSGQASYFDEFSNWHTYEVSNGQIALAAAMIIPWGKVAKPFKGLVKGESSIYRAANSGLRQTGAGGLAGSADEDYAAIRASTDDVAAIAGNTGIKPSNIQKVKDLIFNNEHLLDRYVDQGIPAYMSRFDSHEGIAAAWQRLSKGKGHCRRHGFAPA